MPVFSEEDVLVRVLCDKLTRSGALNRMVVALQNTQC